ncbi:MAG: sulfite exporter TauE/SafE family protein [Candidimonas sp.]|jgi:uncharacterized membrane protein YfcA
MVFVIALAVLGTSFLSGIFGMAGGMILMGVLVAIMPVSAAMMLHGAAQMTSNGWRALMWRGSIDWPIFFRYILGLLLAGLAFSLIGFVPDRAVVLIALGIVPFLAVLIPQRFVPQVDHRYGAHVCGFVNTAMQFVAGVSGPLLDVFFIRSSMDRRRVVATKAACQTLSHLAKLVYFSSFMGSLGELDGIILGVAVVTAIAGSSLSKFVLERISDTQFRLWTKWIVMAIGVVYLAQGAWVLLGRA